MHAQQQNIRNKDFFQVFLNKEVLEDFCARLCL